MKYSTLIVGGGSIGERHVRCFGSTGRAELTLCEPSEARGREVADRYGIKLVAGFSAALASRPECVVLCTPAPMHVPMAIEAMRTGAHVLIEKPLGVTLGNIAELEREVRASGKNAGVAYVWRLHPAARRAHDIIRSRELGEPLQVTSAFGQDFAQLRKGYERTYYARREEGGGAIQDGLTHAANLVEMLLGPTTSVLCEADHLAVPGVEVEDTVGVVARNGRAIAVYSFNQIQKPNEFSMEIHCSRGSLRLDLTGKRIGIFREGNWSWEHTPYENHDVLFTAQADAFLDSVEGKAPMVCSLEDGVRALRFNLACLESAKKGTRVLV